MATSTDQAAQRASRSTLPDLRPLRFGALWHAIAALMSEQRKPLLGYLAAAIIVPYLFFAIFPQASMRGFGALLFNRGMLYSAETPMSAVLADSRDEMTTEVMTGAIVALLVVPIAAAVTVATLIAIPLIVQLMVGSMTPSSGLERTVVLSSLLMVGIVLTRFILAGPIMAARGSINPFLGLIESWRMTRGRVGKLLLVVLPIYSIALAILLIFFAIAALVLMATEGSTWHDTALSGGWLLIEAGLLAVAMLLPAALYRTLAPSLDPDIFS
jgi:hypothetical protein